MKELKHRNWLRTVIRTFLLIIVMFLLVTTPYIEQKDTMVVIKDNSIDESFDKDDSIGGERFEYDPLPYLYPNKGKTLQAFRKNTTNSNQLADEFLNGTDTLNDLDAADQNETVTITPPSGYSGTSGHFNVSDVVAKEGSELISDLALGTPVPSWMSCPHYERISINFTLAIRSRVTNISIDIGVIDGTPGGTAHIEGAYSNGLPNGTTYGTAQPLPSTASRFSWDNITFNTILDPGSYTVVLNASTSNATNRYYWENTQTNNAVVGRDDYDDPIHLVLFYEWTNYDIPFMIYYYAVDAVGAPRDFSSDPPSQIDFKYNGSSVLNYNLISMNTTLKDHVFTMNTSLRFDVDWLESFVNDANSFDTDQLAYNITDGVLAYWNTSFTATNLGGGSYSIQDRVFNVTIESDWTFLGVLRNQSINHPDLIDLGTTFVTINASTIATGDNWTITCSASDYVLNVEVFERGLLGQSLSVNTTFDIGYTDTPNSLQLTYDSSTAGNWTGDTHTPSLIQNPLTTTDVLQTSWPPGQYNVESFYETGVKVGLGVTSTPIEVDRPTSLDITSIPGSVLKNNDFKIKVRFRDTTNNSGIEGVTVYFKPQWSSETTATTNTNGEAEKTISTSDASPGSKPIQMWVLANTTRYYRDTANSRNIDIIRSASLSGLSYKTTIGYNDSTKIQVNYAADANVKINIDGIKKSMGEIDDGRYSYKFVGTEWGLGSHEFTINAAKSYHQGDSVSGSINVGNNPTELRTTGLYVSSVTFPDLQNDSTLQLAYTDTFELSLAYMDLVHNTTTGNASLTFDWMEGELPTLQSGAGGNYTLSIEGTTIGRHTLAINMSQYGHQPQEFEMSFDVVNNPTVLSIDPTIPTNKTLTIEYSEEAMVGLYIEDTNHTLPLSITPAANGWTNYSMVESPTGNYSFTFYGDWVTPEEGQPIDIVFQPYGYEPQTFSFTLLVQHRTIIMTVEVEGLEGTTDEFNMTAGESIFVNAQLNYTNGDPVPNVDVIAIFTVGPKSSQGSSPSLALNVANLQNVQLQSFNITGTTDKQGWVVLAFKTTADMRTIQNIEVVFEGDATNGAVGMEFSTVNIRIFKPIPPTLMDMLLEYWYLTVAAAVLVMILIWYLVRLTRRRLVYRVELEKKIQRTYDFIMDIVNLDAIIGILRDGTAFYDLMIGEELDPQLYSSFLTALRTYASTTIAARRPVEAEEDLVAEAVDTEEKAHALMGDKESYIASGELISFAFVFTARFDETGQWQSISSITRDTAREAVEEIEIQFESEILQFQEVRDLSAIPQDHIYLAFSDTLGLDFLKPHLTTRRGKDLTKEEQTALKVARNIEALEGQIHLPLVAKRLMGEGMARERAIYALQQLRVKGGVETVEQNQVEDTTILEEEGEREESAGEE